MSRRKSLIPGSVQDRHFLLLVCTYVGSLLAAYIYYGVVFQFTLGIVSLALLPLTVVMGRTKSYVREWMPFVVLLLSYEALQGLAGSLAEDSTIVSIFALDKALWGTNLTGLVQNSFYSPTMTDLTTILYSLHLPLVGVCGALLWFSSKIYYRRYVYSLLITSYFSLLVFVLMPTAPPWYSGVATNLVQSQQGPSISPEFFSSFNSLSSSFESDPFAAFPSLHAAYTILFAYFTTRVRYIYGIVSIPIAGGVLFSTLYLGQHYLIDLIGGSLVAASSILISAKLSKMASQTPPLERPTPLKQGKIKTPRESKVFAS